jgi:hypothetical protein
MVPGRAGPVPVQAMKLITRVDELLQRSVH